MKKTINLLFIFFLISFFSYNSAYSAMSSGSTGSGGGSEESLYKEGKKLVYRAKKLDKKNKKEKAERLFLKAINKLERAYAKDKKKCRYTKLPWVCIKKNWGSRKSRNFLS